MPTLYVIATPIGNLGDMSPRAVETLKNVGLIAAEDTRVTVKLTAHFDIHTPLTSCHEHNEENKSRKIIEKMLVENIDAALATDAGTPAISDPGYLLVKAAWEAGINVLSVPGPTAMASALSICGFDTAEFAFYGFLPRQKKELLKKLTEIGQGVPVAVMHESPHRVVELMEAIAETFPVARVAVCCDLTKRYELTLRGNVMEVLTAMRQNPNVEKGEYCLVLDLHDVPKQEENKTPAISLEARILEAMLNGAALREAVDILTASGEKKNAAYAASLRVKEFLNG
jgi:16S rRNA (cytidine1402-2'-O)-methyltransferase